ncbi:transglutaminaseTgpA domain-containing protein [Comamonas guangdongensis]|uniref:TransglutaminaseTgpA domain-containing protein n=1 Tax=Comamonas guangdongensis TaxID=510515 RepID=A0ABV3ZZV5_9BURK
MPANSGSPWLQRLAALPRDARDTLFLLTVSAWILLPQIQHLPWWASAFAAGLLLWRARLAWSGAALPGRWALAAALAVAIGATWATHKTIVGRDAGVTLVVMLLALKTLELRAQRDAMVVFFLGFFVLLSNFFYSQSLPTALAMVLGLMGLLTALVNAHMTAGRPPLLQALRTAAWLALWGAPVMVALFLFFPRMAPLWGVPADDLAGRSGLSENMRVGEVASLALDDSVALRIRFDTPGQAAPEASALYFRGPVLSRFDGRSWQADDMADAMASPQLRVSGEPVRYQMLIEPSKRRWLTLLDAVRDEPQIPPGASVGRTRMASQLQWLTQRPITDVLRVEAQSYTQFSHGPLRSTPELQRYLQLPPGSNPRTQELGRQLLAQAGTDAAGTAALIAAAMQRLRSGGYTYTLEPGVVDDIHTADDFWFESKQGFCEHIASAFAVLMRGMGVPTRIVTGYQGGERNSVDGYWTVRNSDAHAWTEVWIADRGWTRVDPTGAVSPGRVGQFQRLSAPRGAIAAAMVTMVDASTLQQLRAVWEAVNNRWNQWVINYTQSRQLNLLQGLGFESPSWTDLLRLLAASLSALALLWLAWSRATRPRLDGWSQLMHEARQRLQRAGIESGPSVPARGLAQAVQHRWEGAAAPLAKNLSGWLLDMERLRYAAPSSSAAPELKPLRERWRALKRQHWPQNNKAQP